MSHPSVVVMGVSGSGKSTVGRALADRLEVPFQDGDDLHPAANVEKMRAGTPLDDADRWPWLDDVGEWLAAHADRGGVVACSALKRSYRDRLRSHAPGVWFLHLAGDRDLVEDRQRQREGHFMPPSLLSSQLSDLEPLAPEETGLTVGVDDPVDLVVEAAVTGFRRLSGGDTESRTATRVAAQDRAEEEQG